MALRGGRLIGSLVVGLAFALLTWLTVGGVFSPFSVGPKFGFLLGIVSILLIPGMFLGFLLSHNVHIINIWLMVMGNFFIYFGVAYLVSAMRAKRKGNRQAEYGGET